MSKVTNGHRCQKTAGCIFIGPHKECATQASVKAEVAAEDQKLAAAKLEKKKADK